MRIKDWSSDVCSSDLHAGQQRKKQLVDIAGIEDAGTSDRMAIQKQFRQSLQQGENTVNISPLLGLPQENTIPAQATGSAVAIAAKSEGRQIVAIILKCLCSGHCDVIGDIRRKKNQLR